MPDEVIMKFKLLFLCTLGLAASNAMACYTVYDRFNRVVYSGQDAPVDMRYQLHETVPRVYPGGHMVFGNETDCPRIQLNPAEAVNRRTSSGDAIDLRVRRAPRG
jgi:hypothetical protein